MQQQQLVQQRVITLAHAMGGRHVLQDGSLWTRPIGRPPLPPGSEKAQRGAVQSVEAPSDQKNADAALQAAQTVLALYSEATRREMFTLAPHPYNGVHCTHLHAAGTSAAPQWGKRGIWG